MTIIYFLFYPFYSFLAFLHSFQDVERLHTKLQIANKFFATNVTTKFKVPGTLVKLLSSKF